MSLYFEKYVQRNTVFQENTFLYFFLKAVHQVAKFILKTNNCIFGSLHFASSVFILVFENNHG